MNVFLLFTSIIACLDSLSAWEVSETGFITIIFIQWLNVGKFSGTLNVFLPASQGFLWFVNAVVGHSAELPCDVTATRQDDKLFILAWYRNGSDTAFFSRDMREGARVAASGGRFQLVQAESEDLLRIRPVRPDDAGLYQCLADFAFSPSRTTYVQLNVIEPPQRLWVVQENGSRIATARPGANSSKNIGPCYVGDNVHLFCVAFGGKPQASISWWSEQRLLGNRTTALSEQRVRADVTYAPLRREDHGRVLTCLANNNDVTAPLAIDIVIDMHRTFALNSCRFLVPPELVAVRRVGGDDGRVRSDDTLVLQCRVLGAQPAPPITWRLGESQLVNLEQHVQHESSQRLVVSEVRLSIDHTWDEAQVTCCVRAYTQDDESNEQYTCAQALPLTVLYPPLVNISVDGKRDNCTLHVIKGSDVTMNCTHLANPPAYQLIWFHEDDIITHFDGDNDTIFHPILELNGVTEKDAGEYVCAAINAMRTTHSDPVFLDVTYPAFCEDESIAEYGLGANESINITCNVKANPEPLKYGWVVMNEEAKTSVFNNQIPLNIIESDNATFLYTRPNDTAISTIFCWGINEVVGTNLPTTPCSFQITDQTAPRPPANCVAVKAHQEITITCDKGHDGGLPQKFTFIAKSTDTEDVLVSITNLEPKFMIQDLMQENYKFEIVASNEKGDSKLVAIDKESILDELAGQKPQNAVANITTLALALCGGVLLVALAACGLVLCAHDRGSRPELRARGRPPLCAYNTEETNCNDSDDSECNVRRTESFRRAMARYPSKNFDVRRSSSFHSTRYLHDFDEGSHKHSDMLRHSPSCRVHSMQNIHRRRDMDTLCDHLATHLPSETTTFHTMPRKMRHKLTKDACDEVSVITGTSDGFSLPPPPDEFGTYRSGTKIKDVPKPTYSGVVRKNSSKRDGSKQQHQQQYSNVIISPINTVGLPAASGAAAVYSYPDDDGPQELLRTPGVLTTFQTNSSPRESRL